MVEILTASMIQREVGPRQARVANSVWLCLIPLLLVASADAAPAVAGQPVRVGVAAFPIAQANPFRDVIAPRTLPETALFDTLTRMTSGGELEPQLALSWHAEDPLTWIFRLRRGVKFSNGKPFSAATVVAVLELLQAPTAAAYSIARELVTVKQASVLDAHTLVITTHYPDLMLPRRLSALRIPEPEHWQQLGPVGFAQQPVGTGSYQLQQWSANRIHLTPSLGAWRPAKSAVEVILIPDPATRLQALLSGAVDIAVGVGPDDTEAIASRGGTSHIEIGGRVMHLAFITVKDSPLQDSRVRRALNFAVNRPLIVATILRGATVPASQAIPRQAFGYDPALRPYPYDPAAAKALLVEAGFADGFAITASVAVGSSVVDEAYYQAIAQDLRRVGVRLRLERITVGKLVQYIYEGGWPGEAFGMDFGTEPSLDGLRPFLLHSCLWSQPWHCDPAQVPVIEAAQREFDPQRRLDLVRQLVRRHHQDPPGIMMFELPRFDGLVEGVDGYATGPAWIDLSQVAH
jgi:peptide/nickel transport system substrate-binding protein